jgi:arsenate reductase (glutaredoxin)
MITLYGISNCDTIKKAKRWLDEQSIDYIFHDYKKLGIDETKLTQWCNELGYQILLNQRGTTWRKLSDEDKADLNEKKAIKIMINNTSIIKRPVLDTGKTRIVGFNQSQYESLL